jgi:hypothetical protein
MFDVIQPTCPWTLEDRHKFRRHTLECMRHFKALRMEQASDYMLELFQDAVRCTDRPWIGDDVRC